MKKKKLPNAILIEVLFLVILAFLFILLNIHDLNSWYYSVIGDEYVFYFRAKNFNLFKTSLFSQQGVYGCHPVLSSFYQFLIMSVFGKNNFGWRLSSVLIVPFSLPAFYLLVKNFFGQKEAFFSSLAFCFSFYFFAYAHVGYNNLQVIFPFVYALWLTTEGIKRNKLYFFFLAGVFAGLGWYTFYLARITILLVLWLLFWQFLTEKKKNLVVGAFFLIFGFLLTIFPLFNETGAREILNQTWHQSVLEPQWQGLYFDDPLVRWWENFKINLVSFFTGKVTKHFLVAPLTDFLSRVFIFLGLFKILKEIKKTNYAFLLAAYFFSIAVVAFNPIKEIVVSRMQISVLLLAIFAGIGWKTLDDWLGEKEKKIKTALGVFFFLLLVFLNIKKFWLDIPRHYPVTKESLIFRAAQKGSVSLVIYEGKLKNQTFREIMTNYQTREVVFVNEEERSFPSPPFLFLNNDGQTDWFQMKALIQKTPFCPKNQLVKINDFTHQNWIEALYCY